jgi:hypothetical protein
MSQIVKIVVSVPEENADNLRKVIGDAGGGVIGNYTHCSFSIKGAGRCIPQTGAHPAIGQVGRLEEIVEERIEFPCDQDKAKSIIEAIRHAHPYEEPVIDVYPLLLID